MIRVNATKLHDVMEHPVFCRMRVERDQKLLGCRIIHAVWFIRDTLKLRQDPLTLQAAWFIKDTL